MPLTAEARHEDHWHRNSRDRPDRLARAGSDRRKAPPPRAPQATYPGVYPGSGRVNTDPDPNVQFDILRQQNWRKGG